MSLGNIVLELNKQVNWNKINWKQELKEQFLAKFADVYDRFCEETDLENNLNLVESLPSFIGLYHTAGKDMHITNRKRRKN